MELSVALRSPLCYPKGMGKIIRRTVTITVSEIWTIVWAGDVQAEDDPLRQATTILQDQPKNQEEPDEALQITVSDATAGDPAAALPMPTAVADRQPDSVPAKPDTGRQRKRTRRRRAEGNQPSKFQPIQSNQEITVCETNEASPPSS